MNYRHPHIAIMSESKKTSPSAFRVEAAPLRPGRYLWAIGYGFQIYRRSPESFATRREAKNDAVKAMSKIEAHWRAKRDASRENGKLPRREVEKLATVAAPAASQR